MISNWTLHLTKNMTLSQETPTLLHANNKVDWLGSETLFCFEVKYQYKFAIIMKFSVVVDFLFIVTSIMESVIVLCFVVRYFMSILALQSS